MATDREELELKIPSAANAVVAEFSDRAEADDAVDRLTGAGIGTDQISLVARGAGVHEGTFQPGVIMVTVHAGGRDEEVERMLKDAGAHEVRCGAVSSTGDVIEVAEEREEVSS